MALVNQLGIQLKCDMRDKGILVVFYIVPLLMYFVLGSIMGPMSAGNSDYMLEGTCCIFTVSMAAFVGLPQGMVRVRSAGVLDAYKVAGIPSWAYLVCNVLLAFVHILLVCIIMVLSAPYIFGTAGIENLPLFWGTQILLIIASLGVGTLLAAVVKKQSAISMVGILVFLPSLMFTGIMFPSSMLPEAMQKIGSVFPAAQAQNMLTGAEPAINAVILALTAAVAFAIAIVIFRRASKNR